MKNNQYKPKDSHYTIIQCSCGRCCNEEYINELEQKVENLEEQHLREHKVTHDLNDRIIQLNKTIDELVKGSGGWGRL